MLKRKLKRYRVPRVGLHEIIAVSEIGKDEAAQRPRMIFFLAQRKKKKKTNERAITNGPLCRQFHLHTVMLEANIAFCDTILVS